MAGADRTEELATPHTPRATNHAPRVLMFIFIFILVLINIIQNGTSTTEPIQHETNPTEPVNMEPINMEPINMKPILPSYWKNIQSLAETDPRKFFGRTNLSLSPQIGQDASLEVLQNCAEVATNHIIWLGGPPGVGKSTLGRNFQNHGFLVLDCEDGWNRGYKLEGLINATKNAHKDFNASFVFPACYAEYLLHAPEYVDAVAILPTHEVYEERWKARDPNDRQSHDQEWRKTQQVSNEDSIIKLEQSHSETPDETCIRICNRIKNNAGDGDAAEVAENVATST